MLYLQDRSALYRSLPCVRNRQPLPRQSGHHFQHNMPVRVLDPQLLLSAMLTVPQDFRPHPHLPRNPASA
jgi:hypothetical protein